MTAPTFVSEAETATNATTPKTVASVSVQAGDIIVVRSWAEHGVATLGTPSDGTNTYTNRALVDSGTSNEAVCGIWTATAASTASITVSQSRTAGSSEEYGFNVEVWRNVSAIGNAASNGPNGGTSGTPSQAITTGAPDSALTGVICDWNAADGASRTWLSINGSAITEDHYVRNASTHTAYAGRHPNVGTAASKTFGLSAPGSQKYSIAVLELRGPAGGSNVDLDGSRSVTATVAAALANDRQLAAARSVTAAPAGALTVDHNLAAARTVTADVAGALQLDTNLAAARTVSASIAAGLTIDHNLDAPVTAAAARAAGVIVDHNLDGTVTVTAGRVAAAQLDVNLAGSVAVVAAPGATFDGGGTNVNLDAPTPVTASVAGALAVDHVLETAVPVTAAVAGVLQSDRNLDATRGAGAAIAAAMTLDRQFDALRPAAVGIAADLALDLGFAAPRPATATITASLSIGAEPTLIVDIVTILVARSAPGGINVDPLINCPAAGEATVSAVYMPASLSAVVPALASVTITEVEP